MPDVTTGNLAHVVGTFDLAAETGTIDYVTPVSVGTTNPDEDDVGLRLVGRSPSGEVLFDLAAKPQRNSCVPHATQGTYERLVPVSEGLHEIRLLVKGAVAATFKRGAAAGSAGGVAFGGQVPGAPNRLTLTAAPQHGPTAGVTYAVQAKAESASNWQTLAVGLPTPTAEIDVNQFPGSKSVEVRVLRSDGFSESEVFKGTKVVGGAP